MSTNDANSDKTAGFWEPVTAIVELDGETITIDAAHHIRNDRAKLLHLYVEERAGGIDVTVPFADGSAAGAWAKTDVGRRALGIDTDNEQDADAGDQDGELVADGGRDVPVCTCGADLLETADLNTTYAPATTSRRPRMEEVPAAACGECGEAVGAQYGMRVVTAIWAARGESLPGHDDSDDEPEFICIHCRETADSRADIELTSPKCDATYHHTHDWVHCEHCVNMPVIEDDVVTVRDEDRSADPGPWQVERIENGMAHLWSAWQLPREEPVDDLTIVERAEDTDAPVGVPGDSDGDEFHNGGEGSC